MSIDPSVIEALLSSLEQNPNQQSLRLHLADLLLQANRPKEALNQALLVIEEAPDNCPALELAARASEAYGETGKAAAYRRLLKSLGGSVPENTPVLSQQNEKIEKGKSEDGMLAEPVPVSGEPARLHLVGGDAENGCNESENSLKLSDVGGMEEVKKRIRLAFLEPLRNPELRKMYGKSLRGGLLLYGPPGCGKTFIARATAGELKARFFSIHLSDVLDMWLGESERHLHELFEEARRAAPCVLFFDEIDALGRKRSLIRNSSITNAISQLLDELDGVDASNEGVFVLAATNHPWDVDTALRRPGRLDRTVLVVPPDKSARIAILSYHLKGRPLGDVDLELIAEKTRGFSGADIAYLCESSVENAMERAIETGTPRPINQLDFEEALKKVKPSSGPWFETAKNYAMFANEGGVYDELLQYIRGNRI